MVRHDPKFGIWPFSWQSFYKKKQTKKFFPSPLLILA